MPLLQVLRKVPSILVIPITLISIRVWMEGDLFARQIDLKDKRANGKF